MAFEAYPRIGPPVQVIPPSTTEAIYIERPVTNWPLIIGIMVIILIVITIIVILAVVMSRRGAAMRCATNFDCAPGTLCDPITGNCQQCLTNANCSNQQPRCDPNTHTCVACQSNLDCPSGANKCSNGNCVGCTSNADCAANSFFPRCNLATGRCTALI